MQAALQAEPAPTGGDEDLEAEAALADVLRQEQEVREVGGPTQPGAAAAPEWAPPPGAQEGAELKELRERLASKTREAEHATQLLKEEARQHAITQAIATVEQEVMDVSMASQETESVLDSTRELLTAQKARADGLALEVREKEGLIVGLVNKHEVQEKELKVGGKKLAAQGVLIATHTNQLAQQAQVDQSRANDAAATARIHAARVVTKWETWLAAGEPEKVPGAEIVQLRVPDWDKQDALKMGARCDARGYHAKGGTMLRPLAEWLKLTPLRSVTTSLGRGASGGGRVGSKITKTRKK